MASMSGEQIPAFQDMTNQWWDLEQDGPPPHMQTVWVAHGPGHGEGIVRCAVYHGDDDWRDAFDSTVNLHHIVAWRRFVFPRSPVRKVLWAEPTEEN